MEKLDNLITQTGAILKTHFKPLSDAVYAHSYSLEQITGIHIDTIILIEIILGSFLLSYTMSFI